MTKLTIEDHGSSFEILDESGRMAGEIWKSGQIEIFVGEQEILKNLKIIKHDKYKQYSFRSRRG